MYKLEICNDLHIRILDEIRKLELSEKQSVKFDSFKTSDIELVRVLSKVTEKFNIITINKKEYMMIYGQGSGAGMSNKPNIIIISKVSKITL